SLDATGSTIANDAFALDVRGVMQRIPSSWAESIDTSFAKPGDTPFRSSSATAYRYRPPAA
ncbi:MAG TPA: hypothetical protein VGT79_01765, partial [Xanthomonadaceae bacterium]|nr:hypothetical protein [Xanthomonadaceae bacterium]